MHDPSQPDDVRGAQISYISEPTLTFGYGQKMIDPRDGITLFGPFTINKLVGQINAGIIGPQKQRCEFVEYLKCIHRPVNNVEADIARPFFPGLEAAFNVFINFSNLPEVEVSTDEIDLFLKYSDSHQRVYNLVNLYVDKLKNYQAKEEMPVNMWFIVIPDSIFQYCRPKSKIPSSSENIKIGLSSKEQKSGDRFLFEDMEQLRNAYQFEINFHNQIKAKLLEVKVVTQIIRESTFGYAKLWNNPSRIEKERKFDTAKAWNISTTLYYKAGGLPWRLGDVREGVCYLGLVYKKLHNNEKDQNACCAAQMFLDSGDGVVFRGNIGPWYNPETKEYHLKEKDAMELISQSLEAFREKNVNNRYPEQVFIHAKTYFNDEEWKGFLAGTEGKSELVGVRIRSDTAFKLYRDYSYCIPRGAMLRISHNRAFLWSKGFVPRLQTQFGLETPNPLDIEISRGAADIKTTCKDILALTKLNYNSCIYGDGIPVTLRFADCIGEILTAGKGIKTEILTFKHYI